MKQILDIFLFTIVSKIVLFPFSLMAQKNSIKMVQLQPQIDDIKARSGDDYRVLSKELKELYRKERYSNLKNIFPLLLQIPIIVVVFKLVNKMPAFDLTIQQSFIAILSAISAFFMCYVQNKLNPLVHEQGFFAQWGVTIFLTIFSGYFACVSPVGVGIYWISSNILSISVSFMCNIIYNPKKYIDYKKRVIKKPSKENKQLKKMYKEKEKMDVKRFNSAEKEVVFYSEKSGFYKYLSYYIDYILENTDIVVHYLTSDYNDKVFEISHPNFKAYYCGGNALITLFMKMEAKIVLMSMPDLDRYQYKRSLLKKDIEYIYVDHGFGSVNLMLRKGALDYFDTIFCYGKSYNAEILAMEKEYKTPEKKLVNVGFGLFDIMAEKYKPINNKKKTILIAPSWQRDNILETCLDDIMDLFENKAYRVIIRPHPEFIKRFPEKTDAILAKYGGIVQTDFSDNNAILQSDILITDWSTISAEFSFVTKKPCLFINTPMKVMNSEYRKIPVEPIDIALRNQIGIAINIDEIHTVCEIVERLLNENYKDKIKKVMEESLYNIGSYSQIGSEYIIEQVYFRRKNHDKKSN